MLVTPGWIEWAVGVVVGVAVGVVVPVVQGGVISGTAVATEPWGF